MKVLVLGAGGIIGQHMKLYQPKDVTTVYTRRKAMPEEDIIGLDVTNAFEPIRTLRAVDPDVVVNLMGESRTDVVEKQPHTSKWLNVDIPHVLAQWCKTANRYLVHVSSQGVFNGDTPPYSTKSSRNPVNEYGRQKAEAENEIANISPHWTIARVTFVLGARPHLRWGRSNPFENMLQEKDQRQVQDRWFSPSFARDVAQVLWKLTLNRVEQRLVHVGHSVTTSRYQLAHAITMAAGIKANIAGVSHDDFPGIAPRPRDTTYAYGSLHVSDFDTNLHQAIEDWRRVSRAGLVDERGSYAGP